MQAWGDKKVGEIRTRTLFLPLLMRQAGITITGINGVTAAMLEGSPIDPTPSSLMNGPPQVSQVPLIYKFQTAGIAQAAQQSFKAGLQGCTYVVTWDMNLSTGERLIRDTTQYIPEYVPSGSQC